MKTELEIANERILELENEVKNISFNLPVTRSFCECSIRNDTRWKIEIDENKCWNCRKPLAK